MEPATQKPCPGPPPPRLVRSGTAHPLPPTAPPTPIPPRPTCALTSQHRRSLKTPQGSLSSFRTVAPCLAQGRGPRTPRAGKGGRRGCPEALRYTVAVTTKLINFTKEGGGRSTRPKAPTLSGTQRGPQAVASAVQPGRDGRRCSQGRSWCPPSGGFRAAGPGPAHLPLTARRGRPRLPGTGRDKPDTWPGVSGHLPECSVGTALCANASLSDKRRAAVLCLWTREGPARDPGRCWGPWSVCSPGPVTPEQVHFPSFNTKEA